ncbi:MAG: FKBP-type peptidyl-prolyl cis-trans isomerase [Terriglobales bacterium]
MHKFSTFLFLLLATSLSLMSVAIAQTHAASKPATAPAKAAQSMPAKTPNTSGLTTQKEKFSYALGMNLGMNMKRQAVPVDADLLARGIKDSMAGGKMLLTEDEAHAVMMEMQTQVRKQQQEKAEQLGAANKKEGEAFLAANKAKADVVTLPSGLQYKILKAGAGPKPAATDTVTVNYRGTLIDGTEFDSSYKRGEPASFPVTGVIKGWTEALQLMPVGSKWQLFIPADLAYGERGGGATIGPNATLVFEVELLSIGEKKSEKPEEKK